MLTKYCKPASDMYVMVCGWRAQLETASRNASDQGKQARPLTGFESKLSALSNGKASRLASMVIQGKQADRIGLC